ncbi:MAG: siphovirus ReqiPepy6 Gp37-like family protein [Clostridia bacterium]|nr:siphovirus ReqiPepy6 Gp37-like family protein [Clostridia bacterium]
MELYFLDRNLQITLGPIDTAISLVWTERWGSSGTFTLVLPMTGALFAAVLNAAYLEVRGRPGLGRVERIRYNGGDDSRAGTFAKTMTVSGRMAESLLSDRIIPRGTAVTGTLCRAVEEVVRGNAADKAGERAIPCLSVAQADEVTDAAGLTVTIDDRVSGRPLDVWLYETLGTHGMSYRILPDFDAGVLVFSVCRGLDRTQGQTENSRAIFSSSFSSSGEFDFLSDVTDYRNYAYIAGEGEGEARVTAELDLRTDASEVRRELYVDARDLRSDDGETQMSAEAYRNLLLARGRQRLAEHACIRTLDGTAAAYTVSADGLSGAVGITPAWGVGLPPVGAVCSSSMICGVHYALGDLCDIASAALGMTWSARVTEVSYICEGGCVRVEPRFGSHAPDLRTLLQRLE